MHKDKFVFAQLVEFLDNNKFRRLVEKYNGDFHVHSFSCWNQLLALMFGQLSGRESLRDLIVTLEAHRGKCYHLGLGKKLLTKATFADANGKRDYRIFEDYAFFMMGEARKECSQEIFMLGGNVYAFDSTTIPLCLAIFSWAKFRRRKGGVKIHALYDLEASIPSFYHITTASVNDAKAMAEIPYEIGAFYVFDRGYNSLAELDRINRLEAFFVVRAKQNLQFKFLKWKRRLQKNVLSDGEIQLTEAASQKKYAGQLRLVRFHDEEQDRNFSFITNATSITSLQVANLYRNRWQVELFFKWLKQHLKIKKFWGTTENAVRIQIGAAITAYCLVAIVQKKLQTKRTTYELLQILSASLMDKTPLKDLFEKTESVEPTIFEHPFLPGFEF